MVEIIEKFKTNNKTKLFLFLIYVFPVEGAFLLKGTPFNEKKNILSLIIFLIILKNINKKNALIFGIIFLIFKFSISFYNNNMWSICINDQLTPSQNSFEYEYYEKKCVKSFDAALSNNNYTVKDWELNYQNLNPDFQWMGSNAANFPLGYLNHSKFNIYELRRDWLPFRLYAVKQVEENKLLNIEYVGEVTVQFLPSNKKTELPKRYLNPLKKEIVIPEESESVIIYYKFTNWKFKPIPEIKTGYPYEFYGRLIVEENNSNNIEFISYLLFLCFIIFNLKVINLNNRKILLLLLLSVFISMKYSGYQFPINIYSLIGYLIILCCFFYKSNLNLLFIFLTVSYLVIDPPWDQLNFLIKPSGSDILTYENQARLIFEGDGLRGGESVFWYSPAYRYILFLIHIIFGDGWMTSWQFILSLVVYLLSTINQRVNLATFTFSLFLLLDNIRNLFLFGMSETVSLLLIIYSIYVVKSEKNSQIATISLSIAVLIRPELIMFSLLFLFFKLKSMKNIVLFLIFQIMPLMHNLYFGNKFIPYSTAGTYQRNINYDIFGNLNYLFFNPFNETLLSTLGRFHIYIGFFIIFVSISNFLFNFEKSHIKNVLNNYFIFGLLCLAPYLIYDPKLFYPRHVIIGLCLMSLNENYFINDKLKRLFRNNKRKLI